MINRFQLFLLLILSLFFAGCGTTAVGFQEFQNNVTIIIGNGSNVTSSDNQTLNFNDTTNILSIIRGNSVNLSSLAGGGGAGTITEILAQFGLDGGGSSGSINLSVNTSEIQKRVYDSCPSGSSIRSIDENGTVVCENDTEGPTQSLTLNNITTLLGITSANNVNLSGLPFLKYNETTEEGYFKFNPDGRQFVIVTNKSATSQVFQIINNGSGTSNNALNVVSYNTNDSTIGVNGYEKDRGTVKIVHNYPNEDDSSASAISLLLNGATTAAQGIFIDKGNSTGSPLKITNGSITLVDFQADGSNIFTTQDNDCLLAQELDGTDVFRVSCNSNLVWTRKLIPIGNGVYDLGDSTHYWKDIYTTNILSGDWSNVTITESQISDLTHTNVSNWTHNVNGNNFELNNLNRIDITGKGSNFTSAGSAYVLMSDDINFNYASASAPAGFEVSSTYNFNNGANAFGSGFLFWAKPTVKVKSGFLGSFYSLASQPKFYADGGSVTSFAGTEFLSNPTYDGINGGVLTLSGYHHQYWAQAYNIGSHAQLNGRSGFAVGDGTVNGNLSAQTGLLVDELDAAQSNSHIVLGRTTVPSGNYSIYSDTANPMYHEGGVTINALSGTYGSGSAYVCVYNNGTLFASNTACP